MADLPELTESSIRDWTDPQSFDRGAGYYRNGRILHPRVQGRTLKAACVGSMPEPYRVEVTLGDSRPASGRCSCPVGHSGHCKHAVALLLTWLHDPEAFTEVAELTEALRGMDKEALIGLIERMIDRDPDLESLVEIEVLAQPEVARTINAARIQQQVFHAMTSGRGDWRDGYYIAQQLDDVVAVGKSFQDRAEWQNAATVYATVARTILDEYDNVYDEEGDVLAPIYPCVQGMVVCMAGIEDEAVRRDVLCALFDVYRWDADFGVGISDEIPDLLLDDSITDGERAAFVGWIRDELPGAGGWERKQYAQLLVALEKERLDDEAYLSLCRETSLVLPLVERLLDLGRIDEALEEAKAVTDYDLIRIADLLVDRGHDRIARTLVRRRVQDSRYPVMRAWLKAYAESHDDPETVLALAEKILWAQPSLEHYRELARAAKALDRWDAMREDVLAKLGAEQPTLLVKVHLDEGDVDAALAELADVRDAGARNRTAYPNRNLALGLDIEVAEAAEATRPEAAIELYWNYAESLIAQRGRGNYARAAEYLGRVQALVRRSGAEATWDARIRQLREENRRLPALQDELDKAGL